MWIKRWVGLWGGMGKRINLEWAQKKYFRPEIRTNHSLFLSQQAFESFIPSFSPKALRFAFQSEISATSNFEVTVFKNKKLFYFYLLYICSSFKEYLDCSEWVTRQTCGIETGLFIRDFLHRMSDNLMQDFCQELYKGSNQCPSEFSTATLPSSAFSLILIVIIATLTKRRISWSLAKNCASNEYGIFEWFFVQQVALDGYIRRTEF